MWLAQSLHDSIVWCRLFWLFLMEKTCPIMLLHICATMLVKTSYQNAARTLVFRIRVLMAYNRTLLNLSKGWQFVLISVDFSSDFFFLAWEIAMQIFTLWSHVCSCRLCSHISHLCSVYIMLWSEFGISDINSSFFGNFQHHAQLLFARFHKCLPLVGFGQQ